MRKDAALIRPTSMFSVFLCDIAALPPAADTTATRRRSALSPDQSLVTGRQLRRLIELLVYLERQRFICLRVQVAKCQKVTLAAMEPARYASNGGCSRAT